jgi:hypothetical protein
VFQRAVVAVDLLLVAAFHLVQDLRLRLLGLGACPLGHRGVVVGQVVIAGAAQQPVGQDHRHVRGWTRCLRQQACGHILPAARRGATKCPIRSRTL